MRLKARKWDFISEALDRRSGENRFRRLRPVEPAGDGIEISRDGCSLVNFSSNDYLGLARHPELSGRAREYAARYGSGATASRLICGTLEIHHRLEQKLAETYGTPSALVFNSGFQANSTIIPALTNRRSLVLADKRCHNSLLQGGLLSRGDFRRYDHNDSAHLESLLERSSGDYERIVIVTETVFSMDGDRCDLDAIEKLAHRYNALLYVDDAHAAGVWGERGLGLAAGRPGVDILLGTFGKAFGAFGSFVACSEEMRDYLVNFCSGFIYTTALPPPVIGSLDAAVDLVPQLEELRRGYRRRIAALIGELGRRGFDTGDSSTQIIPIIVGQEKRAISLSRRLEEDGLLATAIRPPTVPRNASRIRITLTASHTEDHINRLLDSLGRWDGA